MFLKAVPNVTGLDGRPMPRKAIKSKRESDDKFWDFARQFFFGLWGFRQRPYPPGRPIDVAQAIGYKKLDKRYYDCKFIARTLLCYGLACLTVLLSYSLHPFSFKHRAFVEVIVCSCLLICNLH